MANLQPHVQSFMTAQDSHDSRARFKVFRRVTKAFPAIFHKWFLARWTNATAWVYARDRFTRSAAVWSVVGYIVGLGILQCSPQCAA